MAGPWGGRPRGASAGSIGPPGRVIAGPGGGRRRAAPASVRSPRSRWSGPGPRRSAENAAGCLAGETREAGDLGPVGEGGKPDGGTLSPVGWAAWVTWPPDGGRLSVGKNPSLSQTTTLTFP